MRGSRWAGLILGVLLLGGCAQAPASPAATLVPPVPPSQAQTSASAPTATTPAVVGSTPVIPVPPSATAAGAIAGSGGQTTSAASRAPVTAGSLYLAVTSPADDLIEVPAETRTVVVAGQTTPDALVSVNGVVAGVDASGAFQVTVPLDDDVTVLEVVASDDSGKQVEAERIVVQE